MLRFLKSQNNVFRSRIVGFVSQNRGLSALPRYASRNEEFEEQVTVEGRAVSRTAVLNRPEALNSITMRMAKRLMRLYESWEENSDLGFICMKGIGKAFCSGADVVLLRRWLNEERIPTCKKFFEALYKFVYLQGTYLKPHIAILNGTTMGCGGGISIPGMFRVVTNKTVFCHPEAQLGFHPDAGASYYLSRLPGYFGEYLALTGDKLNGVEMIALNLATHYALDARLSWIEERLGKLNTDDANVIGSTIAQYCDLVYPDSSSVLHRMETIDKCFSHDTVEEIIEALEVEASESFDKWCSTTLRRLKEASPLCLKISLRSIRDGRFQTLDQCLSREYRVSISCITKKGFCDFREGVRAKLVDKDYAPKWDPCSLSDVSKEMVDGYFSPFEDGQDELHLPTAIREPYV